MLAKTIILSLIVGSVALLKDNKGVNGADCRDMSKKRELVSRSAMRVTPKDEMGEGYADQPQLKQILYINQDRAKMRHAVMEKKLKPVARKYDVQRFSAIKPQEARNLNVKEYSTGEVKQEVTGKKLATYFSHWLVLKHIANQTKNNASDYQDVYFVLEDDVEFLRKDWAEQVMCQISKLPADWDMYKFGYWQEVSQARAGTCGIKTAPKRGTATFEPMMEYNKFSCFQNTPNVDTQQWIGNQGYAIRPAAAKHMLTHLAHTPVMDVDGAMMPHDLKSTKFAPNNYYARETILGHDTQVKLDEVKETMSQAK